jgi:hypothetical protein
VATGPEELLAGIAVAQLAGENVLVGTSINTPDSPAMPESPWSANEARLPYQPLDRGGASTPSGSIR